MWAKLTSQEWSRLNSSLLPCACAVIWYCHADLLQPQSAAAAICSRRDLLLLQSATSTIWYCHNLLCCHLALSLSALLLLDLPRATPIVKHILFVPQHDAIVPRPPAPRTSHHASRQPASRREVHPELPARPEAPLNGPRLAPRCNHGRADKGRYVGFFFEHATADGVRATRGDPLDDTGALLGLQETGVRERETERGGVRARERG